MKSRVEHVIIPKSEHKHEWLSIIFDKINYTPMHIYYSKSQTVTALSKTACVSWYNKSVANFTSIINENEVNYSAKGKKSKTKGYPAD